MKKSHYQGIYGEPMRKKNHYTAMDLFVMAIGALGFILAVIGVGLLVWGFFIA